MRISKIFLISLITTAFAGIAHANYIPANGIARSFYENAHLKNANAIKRLMRSGYSIDHPDNNGNTALCIAIIKKDKVAVDMLKKHGADTNHYCVQNIQAQNQKGLGRTFSWKPSYTIGAIAAVAVVGGGVALGSSGGGGGGSGGSNHGGGGSGGGGGDNPTPGSNDMSPSEFETDEYHYGNFLDLVNASSAYSRFYERANENDNDSVNEKTSLDKVNVGIIDTGVYSSNTDFGDTSITGFNVDYGPCQNGDTTHCWTYPDATGTSYLNIPDPDNPSRILTLDIQISQADYSARAADYDSDYDWDENQYNFAPNTDSDSMHGTHIAGIIAADRNGNNTHGIAFSNANIIAARWDFLFYPTLVINRMIDEGAQVINMSFGYDAQDGFNASTLTDAYYNADKAEMDAYVMRGVANAAYNNIIMVMAAGNEAYSQPGLHNGMPLLTAYKDLLDHLFITVVALGHDGKIASYSNRCGVTKNYCIAAPGGDSTEPIISTGTYDTELIGMAGTSMATPVVTGSIALLMGAYPYLTPQQVVELIFESANKTGVYSNEDIYGQGLLDLNAATNPQGYLTTFTGDSVNGNSINISASSIVVPATFQSALTKHMPQTMTAFDKYKRPFTVKTAPMIQTTHSGYKNFKNDLYNFSRRQPVKTVSSDEFSFGFAPSSYKNLDDGMGFVDMSYRSDNRQTSFFFAENSRFSGRSYNDSALFNPYLAMNEAYGITNIMNYDRFDFGFNLMTGENGLYDGSDDYNDYNFDNRSYAFNTELKYAVTPQFNISAVSGILSEDDALLGMNGRGAFDIGDSNTYYTGLVLNWQPFNNWSFGGAYYHGWTDPTSPSGSIIKTSRLLSDSFALDGHYNLNKTDILGLQISSPLRVYSGHADLNIATGRDDHSDKIYRENIRAGLKPSAREYKFALYHNRELAEEIMFRSEIAVRLNPEHNRDNDNDYRMMFGLSFAF